MAHVAGATATAEPSPSATPTPTATADAPPSPTPIFSSPATGLEAPPFADPRPQLGLRVKATRLGHRPRLSFTSSVAGTVEVRVRGRAAGRVLRTARLRVPAGTTTRRMRTVFNGLRPRTYRVEALLTDDALRASPVVHTTLRVA